MTGSTASTDFPTKSAYQTSKAGNYYGRDVFISRLDSSGSSLIYSTYLGGEGDDEGSGISLDSLNRAYVTGSTASTDFPTKSAYQTSKAGNYYGRDVFISRLDSSGSSLIYSTYLGGEGNDSGRGISLDALNRAYVTGSTYSTDFPTKNAYQTSNAGSCNVFISRFKWNSPWRNSTKPWIYDYNGDGTSDIAIFRSASGLWAVRGITRVYFGGSADDTVPGDYDGDGTTEISIFRETSGLWAVRGTTRSYFGSSIDLPEPGDYNGDGTADIGIFRDSSGLWAIRGITRVYFGSSVDSPASGYYDGDSTKDIGIFRESSGLWAIRGISQVYFGSTGDEIVPGDYDSDGSWDYGIFRDTSGLWAIRGVTRVYFGGGTDRPVPADYNGNASDDVGIFRGTSGLWAVRGITRAYYGSGSDIPVTR